MDVSAGVTSSIVGVFLQFGVLGAWALLSMWFFAKVYKRETDRADRAEQALAELNRDMRDKVLPVMIDATKASAEMIAALRDRR